MKHYDSADDVELSVDGHWKKSTRSNGSGACVEQGTVVDGSVAVRDSKNPHGPAVHVSATAWGQFTNLVQTGAVDYGNLKIAA